MDNDPHGHFRDLCLVYGDFYRDVFLEEFEQWFIRGASQHEVSRIRKSVQARAKALRQKGGKRGRPRGRDDECFLYKARVVAWHRIVEGWSWPKIAQAAGLTPTKPNIRTVQRQCDHLAAIIWQSLPQPGHADQPEKLDRDVDSKSIQHLIRIRTGLPFHSHPEQCKKIVVQLAPRGGRAAIEMSQTTARRK